MRGRAHRGAPGAGVATAAGTGWALADQGVRVSVQAVTFLLLARVMGPDRFGVLATAFAVVTICVPIASWGTGHVLVSRVARDAGALRAHWGNTVVVTVVTGGMLVAAVTVVQPLLFPELGPWLFLALGLAELVLGRLVEVSGQVFQALERIRTMAVINSSIYVFRAVAVILALVTLTTVTPTAIAVAYLAASIAAACVGLFVVRRIGVDMAPRPRGLRSAVRAGAFFSLSATAVSATTNVDKPMVARLATVADAGVYAAAHRLVYVAFLPVLALVNVTYARVFREGERGIAPAARFARDLSIPSIVYSLFAGAVLFAGAPLAADLLGDGYHDSVAGIRWLALFPSAFSVHLIAANVLTGSGRQPLRAAMETGATVANISMNLVLIPRYGWRGAAIATLATEIGLGIAMVLAIAWLSRAAAVAGDASVDGEGASSVVLSSSDDAPPQDLGARPSDAHVRGM